MLEEKDVTAAASADALRDEDGAVRADFVERVVQAIATENSATLRELVGELHQADVGDLIEALAPELRPRLVKLMGHDFDFSALTEVDDTVREEILEELPPRRGPRGCATPIPTTRGPSSRTCRRTSRPKFSSSSRRPSEWRWRAACSIRKTP